MILFSFFFQTRSSFRNLGRKMLVTFKVEMSVLWRGNVITLSDNEGNIFLQNTGQ